MRQTIPPLTGVMVEVDLPPALQSPWARFVIRNRTQGILGIDVERRWADDLLALGLTSDAVVALAILRDEEWNETEPLVDAILRELSVDPTDKPRLLHIIRSQIVLAIENGADPQEQAREGMLLASEFHDLPGYDGVLDVFYGIDDEFDLLASGISFDPSFEELGAKTWTLKQLQRPE
ncbi:MAG: hypothetical protein ACK4NU_03705 [Brevundimonas sp.]